MITSRQIINTENFPFIAVLVFKLLNRKVLFINREEGYLLKKSKISRVNYCKIINSYYLKFSGFELLKHVSGHVSVLFQFA